MKKIKKIKKVAPAPEQKTTEDLLAFIKQDKIETPLKVREKPISYKEIPSKRGMFIEWRKKDNVEDWRGGDFLGFYLNLYVKHVGYEDPDFMRMNTYLFTSERKVVNDCLKMVFRNDRQLFKDYLEYIIPWWISDESFVTPIPYYKSVFTKKTTFLAIFLDSIKKSKKPMSRKELDNHYASSDAWADWLEENE